MPNDDSISRKALCETLERFMQNSTQAPILIAFITSVICVVENAPAVDAESVRHGAWQWKDGAAYCTAHKGKMNPHVYGYGYCPMCGAKMDGV